MNKVIPHGWEEMIATYGDPRDHSNWARVSSEWYQKNIIVMDLPYPMRLSWETHSKVNKISCHRLVADDLKAIFTKIAATARVHVKQRDGYDLSSQYYDDATLRLLTSLNVDLYGGCFHYRLKRGLNQVSVHSFGAAIDLDPEHNGLGDTTPAMPMWVVDIFEEAGWRWGGRWTRCDGMHFQRATGY